jgi:hypothetical protein
MSAVVILCDADLLRREHGIHAAVLTDKSESMKSIKVVDVGAIDINAVSPKASPSTTAAVSRYKAIDNWIASEKLIYGPAFASIPRGATAPSPPRLPRLRLCALCALFSGSQPLATGAASI